MRPHHISLGRTVTRSIAALSLALALVGAGCHSGYRITLSNGTTITTMGKPKFDSEENVYRFKDARGQPHALPAFRVQEINAL